MRNFTIFKTGSQRGVNTFMSGEGAIEHPLSTHSAPFGTSWKPAGNTAIIRCMAAMFVLLFTLGVSNAWGATYYGQVSVTATSGGLVNADVNTNGITYYIPNNPDISKFTLNSVSPVKSGTGNPTRYFAAICCHGYKIDYSAGTNGCTDLANIKPNTTTPTTSFAKHENYVYSPLATWSISIDKISTTQSSPTIATATVNFVQNNNSLTVNLADPENGNTYTLCTNTIKSISEKTSFSANSGTNSIQIYDNENLTFHYTKANASYTYQNIWIKIGDSDKKYDISSKRGWNNNTKVSWFITSGGSSWDGKFTNNQNDTLNLLYRIRVLASKAEYASDTELQTLASAIAAGTAGTTYHTAITFGADFEAPSGVSVYLVAPDNFTYTAEHKRGDVVVNSYNMNTNSATTEISSVYADDKIRMIRQNPLDRGYKFVSDRYYKQTTSGGEKVYLQGGSDIRTYTSDDFGAGGTYIGLEYTQKASCSVAYLTSTNGSYSVSGDDPDRDDYPSISKGGAPVVTYDGDKIDVSAVPVRGYKFSRYYTTTDGGSTKTTKSTTRETKLNPYTFGTCSFGVEFVQRQNPLTVSFEAAAHGKYNASGVDVCKSGNHPSITVGGSAIITYSDDEISLNVTEIDEGYAFVRYYAIVNGQKVTLGKKGEATQSKLNLPAGTTAVGAEFSDFPFVVDGVGITDFATALQVAQGKLDTVTTSKTEATIIVTKNATVDPGNYTIPAGVTLLIPYSATQSAPAPIVPRVEGENATDGVVYRTLTLSSGVHLDVYGTLEVSGQQATGISGAGGEVGIGCPTGGYGCMYMSTGSSITLNNGSVLRAWGYVLGDIVGGKYQCEIDARRGSRVQEQFQLMDWKGGTYTMGMTDGCNSNVANPNSYKVLPVNQYYIQNVEVPVKYRPGAKLQANASVFLNGKINVGGEELNLINQTINIDNVGVIGARYKDPFVKDDVAIFLMDNEDDSEDTWVRKYYDVANDKQVYEINNAASLGSLVLTVLGVKVSSTEYKLPITNNFKIHLLSGTMEVTQHTEVLPSAEIEIDKEAALTIPDTVTLYLWDKEDWGDFVSATRNPNSTFTFGKGTTVRWRPGGRPTVRRDAGGAVKIDDAKLIMHGTANVYGYLKTTANGASITSTVQDAGTIIFFNNAPADADAGKVWQVQSLPADYSHLGGFISRTCTSAQLKNEGGTVALTGGTTATKENPISFCYLDFNGVKGWKSLTTDGCFVKDENRVYYIKPQGYVPISIGEPEEKPDHTYRDDYAGTGRIFILAAEGECQWWEVEPVEGHPELFECKHTDNHTFYYYDDRYGWMEKKFNVTFKNWNDTTLKYIDAENQVQDHYELPYNSHPQWLSDNPTRSRDAHNTYEFDGWYPEINSSTVVTGDVVFMAKYVATPREYLITFKDAKGAEIETKQCTYGSIPEAPTTDMAGKKWSPAIGAVTGNQIYQLVDATSTYTVIWKNWNGAVLETDANVTSGTATAYNGATPTKAADQLNSYTFAGWNPEPAETVTADAIYIATYTPVAQTYAINFFQEDGSTPIGATQNLEYGAMPEVPEYSKEAKAAKTYTLVWSPLVSAATKNQNYVATFTEQPRQYTVTWKNGEDVIETNYVDYGTTPVYSGVTPKNEEDPSSSFNGWTPTPAPVTGNQVYTAQFTSDVLTITNTNPVVAGEDGTVEAVTIIITKSGTVDLRAVGSKLEAENLILESDGSTASGQLLAENSQITADHIYFDYKVNAKNHKWYGVAVPWQVDATSGISVNGKTLVLGKDFDIIYYNGLLRASVGKQKCWSYVEDGDKTLVPGRLYMIGLMMDAPTIRFEKKDGASILTTTTSVSGYPSAVATDANWNGVANPALFHAFVNAGALVGQVYNPETNSYDEIPMNTTKMVVGQGAFVQGPNAGKAITVTYGGAYAAAPRRARAEEAPLYDVRIAPAEGNYTDRLFVTVDDEKEADTYVIGKDLAKLGVSKSVAQMWINRYNTELCLNTMTMENGVAEYPLSIFAPKAGEYTITNEQSSMSNEYTLYLTFNGEAIWNLSDAAYTGTFDAGTTSAYGLRISARAPQITTGIDEAVVDAKGETRKVLIDNQVFIIRGEKVYSVDGQLVK